MMKLHVLSRCVVMNSLLAAALLQAQTAPQNPAQNPAQNPVQNPAQNPVQTSPDAQVVDPPPAKPKSKAELQEAAWTILANAVTDTRHADAQTQGLAAVGLLGASPRGLKMLTDAMTDKDLDTRSAAALAAGQTKAPAITTPLRQLLDDPQPPVAFAAAVSLWKMKDYSGEDVLMAVADGDRATAQGRMSGLGHDMNKSLHHPTGVARFAAMQGAGLLLGPFGYGITAYEYLRKNGGDVARVTAIELLAQNRTHPIRQELLAALLDKDPGVRLAAAKALSAYHDPEVPEAIAKVFDDPKLPVKFTAAAAYLISSGAAPGIPTPQAGTVRSRKR